MPKPDPPSKKPDAASGGEFAYRILLETEHPELLSTLLSTIEGFRGTHIVDEESDPASAEIPNSVSLVGYVAAPSPDAAPDLSRRLREQVLAPADFEARLHELALYTDESWRDEWKQFFEPVEIAPNIWVGPPWEEEALAERSGKAGVALVIDPGMAFGTGHHETTRLSAHLLAERLRAFDSPSLLDVGCGSGILSMTGATCGARPIVGIDVNEEAIEAARTNARRNGLADRLDISSRPLDEIEGRFDVVVANILAGVLLELGEALYRRVGPGGRLIISGVTSEEHEEFLAEFLRSGWEVTASLTEGDWKAYQIGRKSGT